MKRKLHNVPSYTDDVIFLPAITPLEASVIPAREKAVYGTLSMVRRAYDAGGERISSDAQRAKIWVR